MEFFKEMLIVSNAESKDANSTMHDLLTGNLVEAYKGGNSARNTLNTIGKDYLISALEDKPAIMIWQYGKSAPYMKMNVPGKVTALAVSKSGQYCIAGIGNTMYIWEVYGGHLINIMDYHSQDITCIRFTNTGAHFITGGKDGCIFVFRFSDVFPAYCFESSPRKSKPTFPKAKYVWLDHMAAISDLHVSTMLGSLGRVYSASTDMTCRIYELDSGALMCVIRLEVPLSTVTVDIAENFIFLGSMHGDIYRINLFETDERELEFDEIEELYSFDGHDKEITSLCVCGQFLISSSDDGKVRVWNIMDFSCIREQNFPGSVTNLLTIPVPPGIKHKDYEPDLPVKYFKRTIIDEDDDVPVFIDHQKLTLFDSGNPGRYIYQNILNYTSEQINKRLTSNDAEMDRLTRINNDLYAFALSDISLVSKSSKD